MLVMTTETVHRTAGKIPFEIRTALSALDSEMKQAVIIALLNEGNMQFSELRDHLSDSTETIHSQTLTNTLEAMHEGGLINKRVEEDSRDQLESCYVVSEFGERFLGCLIDSLGSVEDGRIDSVDDC